MSVYFEWLDILTKNIYLHTYFLNVGCSSIFSYCPNIKYQILYFMISNTKRQNTQKVKNMLVYYKYHNKSLNWIFA